MNQNTDKNVVVAIHQPNFFPWLGYFDKIRTANTFVFMDDAAYPKSGSGLGSWCNRVKINIQGKATWFGCPIKRVSGVQLIKDVEIDDGQPWRKKLLRSIEFNYRKTPNFECMYSLLTNLIKYDTNNLSEFNIYAIRTIAKFLLINVNFVRQSDLDLPNSSSTQLLVDIVKAVGGNSYLCGGGAEGYQEDHLFEENFIGLIYQNFLPFSYGPEDKYLPGLSVIDFLMYEHSSIFTKK